MRPVLMLAAVLCSVAAPLAAQHATVHWTYDGSEGPAHWGSLDATWSACSTGKEQSPIDLGGKLAPRQGSIDEHFLNSSLVLFHNGHTVQAALDHGSTLTVEASQYNALQFHFHHPSEHTVNGKTFPAEIHLVHRNVNGALAVLGVFIAGDATDNPALEALIVRLPLVAGDSVKVSSPVDVGTLLGAQADSENYFSYLGSLTTPPCTEGVHWIVRERPIQASARQLERLKKALGENARPVQPLFARP